MSREIQRFHVSCQDPTAGRTGSNWVKYATSLEEALVAADATWGPDSLNVRQEITDIETGEKWFRVDGVSEWNHHRAPRRQDANKTAARIVRETTED